MAWHNNAIDTRAWRRGVRTKTSACAQRNVSDVPAAKAAQDELASSHSRTYHFVLQMQILKSQQSVVRRERRRYSGERSRATHSMITCRPTICEVNCQRDGGAFIFIRSRIFANVRRRVEALVTHSESICSTSTNFHYYVASIPLGNHVSLRADASPLMPQRGPYDQRGPERWRFAQQEAKGSS